MKNLLSGVGLVFLLTVAILPLQGLGAGPGDPGDGTLTLADPFNCSATAETPCLIQVLGGIIGRFTQIVIPVLVAMILYGGFQMMAARGSTEKYGAGKKTITYAVIGFTVILVSQGIGFILIDLLTRRT